MEFYYYEETNLLRHVVNWVVQIVVVIALAWFAVFACGTSVTNSGQCMQPLLQDHDVVLLNRVIFHVREPERFDVIVFRTADGKTNVKRIIGLPGETLRIVDGDITINGEKLQGADGQDYGYVSLAGRAENPVELGRDEYFVIGDNSGSSEDSRFDSIGNIRREDILGTAWFRISPFMRIGWIS